MQKTEDCVEIFGYTNTDYDKIDEYLKNLTCALELRYEDVEWSQLKGNGLLVKLPNVQKVNEWERKSRDRRLRLSDVMDLKGEEVNTKLKIFAAAPTKFKLLLHNVRKQLPHFKYIWIGKQGVMVRRRSRSQIHLIKSINDINNFL
ncbi:fp 25K [Hyphantria cunea granulovirus]|uniref:Fp 25K n=1 Tax=Hyphantria cunea granulovirus TaxID=307448 RepID=A0AAF1D2A6_9BBAC|nr:fp 25K [Hyphantria cunea granulovirus]QBQ01657.1 fp 25K [Hyphantria cunea granulovirus]